MEAMLFRNPSVAIMASIQRHNFVIKFVIAGKSYGSLQTEQPVCSR